MSLITVVLLALAAVILAVAALIVVNGFKSRGSLARSLDMQLLLFLLPRAAAETGERDERKLISVMEQLYAAVTNLRVKGWNKFLYGDPYIALEMAVHHIGEQIHFYAAVPSQFAAQFEKQMTGVYPTATVVRAPDFNIFNPEGGSAGAYLTLRDEPILPVLTYTELPSDPLGPLVSAMGSLERDGEGVAIQLIVRHSSREDIRKLASDTARQMQSGMDFRKALKFVKHPPKKEEKKDADAAVREPPKVATEFEQKLISALQSKASRPLFDCNLRVLTSAGTRERAEGILRDVAGAFSQYGSADRNGFKVNVVSGKSLERLEFAFAFRVFNEGQSIPLSSEELTSVYHFPSAAAILPRVKFANFKTAEPPPGIPDEGVAFGMNEYRGQSTLLRLSRDDRRRHMYIIGQTGTGKTVSMKAMAAQDMEKGEGLTLLDPHGEFAEWLIRNVPEERIKDVIYFNPADTSMPLGLNMLEFDPSSPQDKTLIVDELFEIISKLFDLSVSGGPQFERYFKNALFLLLDNYERRVPTLADMSRVFVDEAFRNDLLAHETNSIVKQFWELEATKTTGEQSLVNFAGYITSKIDPFTSNDFLRPIINQTRSAFDFKDIIENRKILVCNLSKGRIGDMNSNLLGMVIAGKLRRAALARDTHSADLPDHYLYMDEFQSFTTDSIAVILSEARKYRLCLIICHQFIKQLQDKIRDAVFGNVGSMVVFRVSPEDAEMPLLKTKFEPVFSPHDLSNIDNYNAYVSMLVRAQVARPTSMRGLSEVGLRKGDVTTAESIIGNSRRFGRPKEEVEAEIQQRFQRIE